MGPWQVRCTIKEPAHLSPSRRQRSKQKRGVYKEQHGLENYSLKSRQLKPWQCCTGRKLCLLRTHISSQAGSASGRLMRKELKSSELQAFTKPAGATSRISSYVTQLPSQSLRNNRPRELGGFYLNLDFRDLSVESHINAKEKKKKNHYLSKYIASFAMLQHPTIKCEQQYFLCISKECCMNSLECKQIKL